MIVTSKILSLIINGTIPDVGSAVALFPRDVAAAEIMVTQSLEDAAGLKKELLAIPADERTYSNTISAYDRFQQLLKVTGGLLSAFECMSSDVAGRSAANDRFLSESIVLESDRAFFRAFQEYELNAMGREVLTTQQQAYFKTIKQSFIVQGYGLTPELFEQATRLSEQEAALSSRFNNAINADHSFILYDEAALTGIDSAFLASQERDSDGKVKLYCNGPTLLAVLDYCSNPAVRQAFFQAYNRRAYPENIATLESLIAVRDARAKLLGFESFNALRLDDQLIKTPARAYDFLSSIEKTARLRDACDMAAALTSKPADVVLTQDGALLQADQRYVFAAHKKARYSIDDREIAQYFPVQKTVAGIFEIYEKFMNIEFEYSSSIPGAWDASVQGITVYAKGKTKVLGYILLDLYPRPYKYSHACCFDTFSRVISRPELPAVSLVLANFPQAQGGLPALLLHADVVTFFHEFGHALHNTLAVTAHYRTSAFNVPCDFIELPSQILESWMWDRDMLKLVSSHYKTGEALPDQLIDRMLAAHDFGQGHHEVRQLFLALYSLELFNAGAQKDSTEIFLAVQEKLSQGVVIHPQNRMHASFGHLTGYGPMYYGYALSRAYAHDVFEVIKQKGLLDPEIGTRFVDCILAPGASKDAEQLLRDFLGRPACSDAYIAWLASLSTQS